MELSMEKKLILVGDCIGRSRTYLFGCLKKNLKKRSFLVKSFMQAINEQNAQAQVMREVFLNPGWL